MTSIFDTQTVAHSLFTRANDKYDDSILIESGKCSKLLWMPSSEKVMFSNILCHYTQAPG